ncbi:MAG: dienelactone hydrolase family protein [Chloroflexi bacterium]|nr:dienelactone hydrolase family protein [Chloroflexota bacterium]
MTTARRATFEGMIAELVPIPGHNNDTIYGYLARPLGPGPYPGVVVIHHAPGWDEGTKEITRKLAAHGYNAICPNLYHREDPADPVAAAAATRAAGGVPDARCLGDVQGAVEFLKSLLSCNQKVGVIGYCSGGRQTYLVACNLPGIAAAIDCYGGRVVAAAEQLSARQPVAPIEMSANLACPLLGLFGADDLSPSPKDVAQTEAVLKRLGKTYEFHTYEGAGHSFFSSDRPAYRQAAAADGWERVFAWYGKYLSS